MAHPTPDPHAVLGVTPAATPVEITQALQAKLRALRPGSGGADVDEFDDAELQQVLAAYVQLRQEEFDEFRDAGSTPAT